MGYFAVNTAGVCCLWSINRRIRGEIQWFTAYRLTPLKEQLSQKSQWNYSTTFVSKLFLLLSCGTARRLAPVYKSSSKNCRDFPYLRSFALIIGHDSIPLAMFSQLREKERKRTKRNESKQQSLPIIELLINRTRSLARDEPSKGNDAIYIERAISGHTRLLRSRHKELLAFIPVHGYSSCICPSSSGFLPPPNSQTKVCVCVCMCVHRTSTRHSSKRIDLCALLLSLYLSLSLSPCRF